MHNRHYVKLYITLAEKIIDLLGHAKQQKETACYTVLLSTCKVSGIERTAWLKDVLKIITAHPINKLKIFCLKVGTSNRINIH
jgi:hypothetical protein